MILIDRRVRVVFLYSVAVIIYIKTTCLRKFSVENFLTYDVFDESKSIFYMNHVIEIKHRDADENESNKKFKSYFDAENESDFWSKNFWVITQQRSLHLF